MRCRLSPRTLSPGKWEKASRHRTEVEPERQSPSSLWGTASRVCVRLVTEEHATRRGRLESKGQIRKKRETRGSREPSVTRQLEAVQPAVTEGTGADQATASARPISAPSLVHKENRIRTPPSLLPSLFQRGTETLSFPCTHTYTTLITLTGYTDPQEGLEAGSEGHNASKLKNCWEGGARLRDA